jgi:hypothetical protein
MLSEVGNLTVSLAADPIAHDALAGAQGVEDGGGVFQGHVVEHERAGT